MKPTLFVLAAGMGSRYGGLKQLDGVGPNGETIMDYSIFDAIRGGFGKVVFVIRKDFEADFRSKILSKYENHDRPEGALEVGDEDNQIARRKLSHQHEERALPENNGRGQTDHDIGAAFQIGGEALDLHPGTEALLPHSGKDVGKVFFERQGLYIADGGQGFGCGGRHRPLLFAQFAGHLVNLSAQMGADEPEQGPGQQRKEGQLPVHPQHHPDHAGKYKQMGEHRHNSGHHGLT